MSTDIKNFETMETNNIDNVSRETLSDIKAALINPNPQTLLELQAAKAYSNVMEGSINSAQQLLLNKIAAEFSYKREQLSVAGLDDVFYNGRRIGVIERGIKYDESGMKHVLTVEFIPIQKICETMETITPSDIEAYAEEKGVTWEQAFRHFDKAIVLDQKEEYERLRAESIPNLFSKEFRDKCRVSPIRATVLSLLQRGDNLYVVIEWLINNWEGLGDRYNVLHRELEELKHRANNSYKDIEY